MGTKAIEVVIKQSEGTAPYASREAEMRDARAARSELEAIRKASREWVDVDGQMGPSRMQRLDALLRDIAKEEA